MLITYKEVIHQQRQSSSDIPRIKKSNEMPAK